MGNKSSKCTPSNIHDVTLLNVNGTDVSLLAAEVPSICAPLLRPGVPADNLHVF